MTRKSPIKAVLFDFDGTLADTAPGIVLTMQETFRCMGLPIPQEDTIRQTIGLPLADCIRILGKLPAEDVERGTEIYRELFPAFELTHITIFPAVPETVRELHSRGIRMAICTSRGRGSLESILSRNGLWEYFEAVVTASDNITPKPAPDMVLTLLDRMGLVPEDALVVGDTTFDVLMGNRAGCRTIAVTYGNHPPQQLRSVGPGRIIDSFPDLLGEFRQ